MNEIRFVCPTCNQSLETPPDMAGQSMNCPTCAKAIEIPGCDAVAKAVDWYYRDGDKQIGPVPEEAMAALVKAGAIGPSTPVWRESMEDWTALAQSDLAQMQQAPVRPPVASVPASPSLLKRRLSAFAVDVAIIVLINAACGLLLRTSAFSAPQAQRFQSWRPHWIAGLVMFTILWIILVRTTGASLGRLLLQVGVTRKGLPVTSWGRSIARWMITWPPVVFALFVFGDECFNVVLAQRHGFFASFILLLLGILVGPPLLPLLITKGRKGWSDLICGTVAQLRNAIPLATWRSVTAIAFVSTAVILQGINVYHGVFANWISPDGRCLVWFPAKPVVHEVPGKVTLYTRAMTSVFGDGYGYYSLSYEDLPGGSDSQFDWASFEQMIADDDKTILFQYDINVDGWPGRSYLVEVSPRGLNAYCQWYKAFPVGGKLYTLVSFGDHEQETEFFGSFRLGQQPAGGNSGGTVSEGAQNDRPGSSRAVPQKAPGQNASPMFQGLREFNPNAPPNSLPGEGIPGLSDASGPSGRSDGSRIPGGEIFYDPQYGRASGLRYAPTRAFLPPPSPMGNIDGSSRRAVAPPIQRPPPPPVERPAGTPITPPPVPPAPVVSNTGGNRGNRVPMPPAVRQ